MEYTKKKPATVAKPKDISHNWLPLTYSGWDQADNAEVLLLDVEFTDDLGPFKKGAKFDCLGLDTDYGALKTYDDAGKIDIKWLFKAVAR